MNETKNQLKTRIAYILEKQKVLGVAVVTLMMILAFVMGLSFAGPEPTEPNLNVPETTAPTEASKPTEATKPTEPPTQPTEPPTQPTEPPTQPTEPPTQPTEPPTQPTEPTTPQLVDPVEIKTYSVESAYIDVLSINGLTTIDTGKFHASLQSLTKNLDDHKEHEFFKSTAQFDGLYAKAAEIDFAKNYVALVYFAATAEYEPDLAEVLLIEDLPFNGERIFRVHVNVNYDDSHEQFMRTDISKVKYHFLMITIPKTEIALNDVIPKDASVDNIKPPTQPTEPPTQPTEPTTAPKLTVMERVPSQPLTTPALLDCEYKISIIDMPYEQRIEKTWGLSSTIHSLESVNEHIQNTKTGCDLTVKNALCPQSYTEIRDTFVNEEFFKDYALVEILVTNPEGVLPKIEKIEFCKEHDEPLEGWYVRIYVDAEPPSLTDPVYSIWVKVPWTINGITMYPGAQVGGHYFVYS